MRGPAWNHQWKCDLEKLSISHTNLNTMTSGACDLIEVNARSADENDANDGDPDISNIKLKMASDSTHCINQYPRNEDEAEKMVTTDSPTPPNQKVEAETQKDVLLNSHNGINGICNTTEDKSPVSSNDPEVLKPANYLALPPDGGFGWVIVAASFLINGLVDGLAAIFGVYQPEFLAWFGASRGKTALAGSLMAGTFLISGPVVSGLVNAFGCRVVTIAGVIIASLAYTIASFSTNIEMLIVTYGILAGMGVGMFYLPAMVMVGYYFERRRAIATGIACSGAGFGMLVLAPVSAALLSVMSWQQSLYVISAIVMCAVLLGALMRPLAVNMDGPVTSVSLDDLKTEDTIENQTNVSRDSKYSENLVRPTQRRTKTFRERLSMLRGRRQDLEPLPELRCMTGNSETQATVTQGSPSKQSRRIRSISEHETMDLCSDSNMSRRNSVCFKGSNRDDTDGAKSMSHHLSIPSVSPQAAHMYDLPTYTKVAPVHHKFYSLPLIPQTFDSPDDHDDANHCHQDKAVVHRHRQKQNNDRLQMTTQSCHNLPSHSTNYFYIVRQDQRDKIITEINRPLNRLDIFYGSSVFALPEFREQAGEVDIASVVEQLTVLPEKKPSFGPCNWLPAPVLQAFSQMLDFSILASPCFLVIALASALIQVAYFIPLVFITEYAGTLGADVKQAASLVSIIGACNGIGRAVHGALANHPKVSTLHLNNWTLIIAGASTVLCPIFCKNYSSLIGYSVLFGFFVAGFPPLANLLLVQYLGIGKLTNAFGLLSMVRGIATCTGPPIAGVLLDATQSFANTFYFAGCLFILAGLVHYLLPLAEKWQYKHDNPGAKKSDIDLT